MGQQYLEAFLDNTNPIKTDSRWLCKLLSIVSQTTNVEVYLS